ncbi:MAG: molecular chaperone DnaJ [Candidatus Bipolaricaulia bacterium]
MAKRDYYETLGLTKDAAEADIKKVYREKAKALRRDMYRDVKKEESENEFKRVAEAYEVLSDPQKRAQYDRYGHAGPTQGFTFGDTDFHRARDAYPESGFGGLGDLIDRIRRAGERQSATRQRRVRRVRRGESIEYRLRITLEDAAHGTKMTVTVPRLVSCETCSGSGMEPGTSKRACPTCDGRGHIEYLQQSVFASFVNLLECPECAGAGEVIEQPCHRCRGTGRVRQKSRISTTVRAGVDTGSRLRLSGQGNAGVEGAPSGDLFIVIEVIPHERFLRDGRDVHSKATISYAEAALGGKIKAETLWGEETVSIPSGTQPGTTFRLRGKGIANIHRESGKGDHIVEVTVNVPKKLSGKQRRALEAFAESLE